MTFCIYIFHLKIYPKNCPTSLHRDFPHSFVQVSIKLSVVTVLLGLKYSILLCDLYISCCIFLFLHLLNKFFVSIFPLPI